MLRIGYHVSAAGGYTAMVRRATALGANTFAFFTRNPRGGSAKANCRTRRGFSARSKGERVPLFGGVLDFSCILYMISIAFERRMLFFKNFLQWVRFLWLYRCSWNFCFCGGSVSTESEG